VSQYCVTMDLLEVGIEKIPGAASIKMCRKATRRRSRRLIILVDESKAMEEKVNTGGRIERAKPALCVLQAQGGKGRRTGAVFKMHCHGSNGDGIQV